jgi:excinuclease UvrABC ATPase subunit
VNSETVPDWGAIQVRGARENNLRDLNLDIPKRRLTVFTGVSGSGKSSLVFETIAAESRRLINETYTAFLQSFMGTPARPDVDSLENLSAAIIVDQERMGANARSTVGTATDAYAMLRVIYSRLGQPHVGGSNVFSFNDPAGMCTNCEGLGRVSTVDIDALVDRDRSLNEGAITFRTSKSAAGTGQSFATPASSTPTRNCANIPPTSGSASSTAPTPRSKQRRISRLRMRVWSTKSGGSTSSGTSNRCNRTSAMWLNGSPPSSPVRYATAPG